MSKKNNYDYFDEFIHLSDCIIKSSEILKDVFINFDIKKLDEKTIEVHNLENESDMIIHDMRSYLIKDFLPPIDREDIAQIGHKLDNIEDSIDEILINLKILSITEIKEDVTEIIDILILSAKAVKEMFCDFKNLRKLDLIKKKIIEVNDLEEQGDRAYEKLMTSLYKNEKDAINLVKWTNIYNCLEDAIDFCEQVGDCLEDVILMNS